MIRESVSRGEIYFKYVLPTLQIPTRLSRLQPTSVLVNIAKVWVVSKHYYVGTNV